MTHKQEEWLALTKEDAIDPGLPICDAHHHLWERPDDFYLLNELLQDVNDHNVVKTVFVQCRTRYRESGPPEMAPVGETEFIESITAESAGKSSKTPVIAAGIVGFADLTLGDGVVPVLEAHLVASPDRFRGIRHVSAWDAQIDITKVVNIPAGLLLNQEFRKGFSYLDKYGLSYDAWVYHTQLKELVDLAKSFPETTIILNHIGTPIGVAPYANKRKEVFKEWEQGIADLAVCPNVAVKLGGLGMWVCGFGWDQCTKPPSSIELAEVMEPYYLWCIKQFGCKRCMFESNFPVDKLSYSYTVLWNAFKRIAKDFSNEEKAALFYDTADNYYRLG
ncbi:MAG: amidohydrolase family protein [Dehalococcoidales bacterium]|nr:amidohydrolase family protein [Dehalococcoidales bacterium]